MKFKRILAIIISVIMVFSCMPGYEVYAEQMPIDSVYILVTTNNERPTGVDDPDILKNKPAVNSEVYLWVLSSVVNELVGADVRVNFDSSFLDAVDMDTATTGVQPVVIPTSAAVNEVSMFGLPALNSVESAGSNGIVKYAVSNTSPSNFTQGVVLLKSKFVVKADITSGLYFSIAGLELRGKFGLDNNPIIIIPNEVSPFHLAIDATAKVSALESAIAADLSVSSNVTTVNTATTAANTAISSVPTGAVKDALQTRVTAAQTILNNSRSATTAVNALMSAALKDLTILTNLTDAEAKVPAASAALATLADGSATKTTLQARYNGAIGNINYARTRYNAANNTSTPPTTPPSTDPTPSPVVTPTEPTTDDSVTEGAKTVSDAVNGTEPIENTADINKAVDQAVSQLNNTDENKQTANINVITTQIIANAGDIATKVTDTVQKEAFISTTVNAITAVVNAATSVKTEANAVELAASFKAITQEIATLSNITTNTATQQQLATQQAKINDTMQTVVTNVIANTGTVKATATVKDGAVTVALSQQALTDILAKAEQVVATANNLDAAITANGIDVTVEKKIVLEVATSTIAKTINTELPASILEQVQAKGIESVQIESGVARITVAPDFITKTENTQTIALEVQKIALTDDLISTMDEQQKALLQNAAEIYDFNAMVKDSSNTETKVTSFNSNIEITLPYSLKLGENKENITVLYLADDGTVKNMAGVYDEVTGTVTFMTNHFSKYMIKNNVVKFSDVTENNWAKKEIEAMASKGIVGGNQGKYMPTNNITRAEFAKLITTALNIVDDNAKTDLKDVSKDAWHYEYVASAVKAGIITGKPDGSFGANEKISRQDMATMLTRAIVLVKGDEKASSTSTYINEFTDNESISNYAVDGVATAIKHNLMNGKPGKVFDPKGEVTRAEAAVVIYRLFNK